VESVVYQSRGSGIPMSDKQYSTPVDMTIYIKSTPSGECCASCSMKFSRFLLKDLQTLYVICGARHQLPDTTKVIRFLSFSNILIHDRISYSSRNCDIFSEYLRHLSIRACISSGSGESNLTICLVLGWTKPRVLA